MGKSDKDALDEVLPEFGITRRELESDVKRRIASLDAGSGLTTEQLREKLRRQQRERTGLKGRRQISS